LLYPKEKEQECKKREKKRQEKKGRRRSSVNDMKKERQKRTPFPPIVNIPKHQDAQTTRYPRIRSIS
jgi:hypothetical protein